MNYSNKGALGFTLIEFLVYTGLLATIAFVGATTFVATNQGTGVGSAKNEVNANIRYVLGRITQDIRAAPSISIPSVGSATATVVLNVGGNAITYDRVHDPADDVRVNGVLPAPNKTYPNYGQIRRRVGSGTPEVLTSDRARGTRLVFERIRNTNSTVKKFLDSVRVNLVMEYNSDAPEFQYSNESVVTVAVAKLLDPANRPAPPTPGQSGYQGGYGTSPNPCTFIGTDRHFALLESSFQLASTIAGVNDIPCHYNVY